LDLKRNLQRNLQRTRRDHRHARLLKAARNGDAGAFSHLYSELYDPVADYLMPRLGIRADAEDLIAMVFHRFLQQLERFDAGRGSVYVWILTMARNALIDHLRRQRETVPVDELAEVLVGAAPDPLEDLIQAERAARVQAVLRTLPAETQEMLALHYGQQLRQREIGDLIGLSETAVKKRFSRARQLLRERLTMESNPEQPEGNSGWEGEVDHAT
jgi:RNA polymerase sigma factor (sigma-70 family)